jgi:hypothetical protein
LVKVQEVPGKSLTPFTNVPCVEVRSVRVRPYSVSVNHHQEGVWEGLGVGYMISVVEGGVVARDDRVLKEGVGGSRNEILLQVFRGATQDDGLVVREGDRASWEHTFPVFVDEGDGDAI